MKQDSSIIIFFTILLFSSQIVNGQYINTLRPLDNNKMISIDSTDWKIHRVLKDINILKAKEAPSISFGGEIRQQLRFFQHMNFGDVKPGARDHDIYLLQRYNLHADLRLSKNIRLFGQLNSNYANGKDYVSPVDGDELGILQAFVDFQFNEPAPVQVRIGRQEFSFGSERMLGTREGPNIRQSFDGLRITAKLNKITGDFLIAQPLSTLPGVFDNYRNKSVTVIGAYFARPFAENSLVDAYYFGHRIESFKFAGDTATESRHSVGLRFSNSRVPFYYDAEVIYQFGNFGINSISAWQVSSIVGYRWSELALKPRVQIREGIISGDRLANDGSINSFRPVSARPPINDMLSAGPSNIIVITPEAEVTVNGVAVVFRYMYIRKFTSNDGVYSADASVLTKPADDADHDFGSTIAQALVAELNYIVNQHFSLSFVAGHFFAGNYMINSGKGENNSASSLRVTYKF